ncbi:MAG: M24 family metallopeptidase [Halobacteriaceae archaeon]
MDPDLSVVDDFLTDDGHDGYLVDAADDSTQLYLSGFDAADPFVTLYTPERTVLLVSGLEYSRARADSRADEVRRWAEFDLRDRAVEHGRERARNLALAAFCEAYGVDSLAVPARFPLWTADGLRGADVAVTPDAHDHVADARAVKADEEVAAIRETQRANQAAMAAAEDLLAGADVVDGVLHHEGEALTSERVREEIEVSLVREGCGLDETIVSCGADAAVPHERGSGPLRADETVIVDIFPRGEAGYYGDMTRTFVKGTPGDAARAFYEATERAFEAALDALGPGVTGAAVHDAVCDVYEDAGHATLRSDDRTETGFIHSTGHGVGLDVHESPRLAADGERLRPGHVVTVEPGLYDPEVGGVRTEDLVVVTEDGYENLTDYPHTFTL